MTVSRSLSAPLTRQYSPLAFKLSSSLSNSSIDIFSNLSQLLKLLLTGSSLKEGEYLTLGSDVHPTIISIVKSSNNFFMSISFITHSPFFVTLTPTYPAKTAAGTPNHGIKYINTSSPHIVATHKSILRTFHIQ